MLRSEPRHQKAGYEGRLGKGGRESRPRLREVRREREEKVARGYPAVERGGCQGEGGVLAEWHEAEAGGFPVA